MIVLWQYFYAHLKEYLRQSAVNTHCPVIGSLVNPGAHTQAGVVQPSGQVALPVMYFNCCMVRPPNTVGHVGSQPIPPQLVYISLDPRHEGGAKGSVYF